MKKYGLITIGVTLSICVGAPLSLYLGVAYANQRQKAIVSSEKQQYGELYDYMLTTQAGRPLTAPISNKALKVVTNNFSDAEKQEIVDAIDRLDNIIDNVNYEILDSDGKNIYADIYIYNDADNNINQQSVGDVHTLGVTHFTYDERTAKINYPLTITIDSNCSKYYDSTGVSLLNYVVKHEMMHTLGFADLYDEKYYNKSVMWHAVEGDVNDYTSLDEFNLKTLYDNNLVKIVNNNNNKILNNNTISVYPVTKKKENNMEK